MMRFLVAPIALSILAVPAQARVPLMFCSDLGDCRKVHQELSERVAYLEGNQRGVLVRDQSIPALGDAWRDPSGTIWGDSLRNSHGYPKHVRFVDADQYCASLGLSLPTLADALELRVHMGAKPVDPADLPADFDGYAGEDAISGYKMPALPGTGYVPFPTQSRCNLEIEGFWLKPHQGERIYFDIAQGRIKVPYGVAVTTRCVGRGAPSTPAVGPETRDRYCRLNDVSDCRAQLKQVEARVAKLEQEQDAETRIAIGADGVRNVFGRDRSNPALGDAWRDPSGVIWGDTVMAWDSTPQTWTLAKAEQHCGSIGARLPSWADIMRLNGYMDRGGERSGEPQVLPHQFVADHCGAKGVDFWIAVASDGALSVVDGLDGSGQAIGLGSPFRVSGLRSVRCVMDPSRI